MIDHNIPIGVTGTTNTEETNVVSSSDDVMGGIATDDSPKDQNMKYAHQVKIYHPNNQGKGSVIALSVKGPDKRPGAVFIKIAPQKEGTTVKDDYVFDYDREMIVGINSFEIAQVMDVLRGRKEKLITGNNDGLYHKRPNGVVTKIFFEKGEYGFRLTLSRYENKENTTLSFIFFEKSSEDTLLLHWLDRALAVTEPVA